MLLKKKYILFLFLISYSIPIHSMNSSDDGNNSISTDYDNQIKKQMDQKKEDFRQEIRKKNNSNFFKEKRQLLEGKNSIENEALNQEEEFKINPDSVAQLFKGRFEGTIDNLSLEDLRSNMHAFFKKSNDGDILGQVRELEEEKIIRLEDKKLEILSLERLKNYFKEMKRYLEELEKYSQ